MRLIVFFDLPMVTKAEKRAYVQFRRFLINDGYDMIQWSVYGRLLSGADDQEKHLRRLADSLPPRGFHTLHDSDGEAVRWHSPARRDAPFSGKSGHGEPTVVVLTQEAKKKIPAQPRLDGNLGAVRL